MTTYSFAAAFLVALGSFIPESSTFTFCAVGLCYKVEGMAL